MEKEEYLASKFSVDDFTKLCANLLEELKIRSEMNLQFVAIHNTKASNTDKSSSKDKPSTVLYCLLVDR